MDWLETASLGVLVAAGSRHEDDAEQGLSHLLEHMAFKGTTRRDARAIAEAIESAGGDLNAATSVENTAYYARVLREDCGLALDVLADILTASLFDPLELEREKGVILQEIAAVQDTPDDLVFDLFNAAAYPGQPIGRAILGAPEGVRRFDRDAVSVLSRPPLPRRILRGRRRRRRRSPANLRRGSGALRHLAHGRSRAHWFRQLMSGAKSLSPKSWSRRRSSSVSRVWPMRDPQNYAAHIFANAVGGGMASKLFQEVREKRGLAYSIASFHWSYLDSGLFGFEAATAGRDLPELVRVGLDVMAEAAHKLDEADMARAKAQTKVGLLTALENSSSRAEQIARQIMIFGRVLTRKEMIDKIDTLSLEDVRATGAGLLRTAPTVAVLGATRKAPGAKDISARLIGV